MTTVEPQGVEQSEPSRELLAAAFARSDFETMPWAVRHMKRESLAPLVVVALTALDDLVSRIADVDYWDGSGNDLLDWVLRGRLEYGDGSTQTNPRFTPLVASAQKVQP